MAGLVASTLPGACWGFDCDTKLSAVTAKRLAASSYQGNALRFAGRYVFFGPPLRGDIDRDEALWITDARLVLLLFQHPRVPGWLASEARGREDGKWAADNAQAAGYAPTAHLIFDSEGLGNSGQAVTDNWQAWCESVRDGGFSRCGYVGFDCGLTPSGLYALRGVDRYMSDAGGRTVDTRGVCCRQHATTRIAGVLVDPDEHFPDRLGEMLVGSAAELDDTNPDLAPAVA
jgi:hypothetical protein